MEGNKFVFNFRFLNTNFWSSYANKPSQSIDNLVGKPECTVEKLLEDDDVLSEFKNGNEKLIS